MGKRFDVPALYQGFIGMADRSQAIGSGFAFKPDRKENGQPVASADWGMEWEGDGIRMEYTVRLKGSLNLFQLARFRSRIVPTPAESGMAEVAGCPDSS